MARHRRAAYAEKARLALLRDVFDLDGFDWNRMVAPAALDLALHGEAFDGHDRMLARLAGLPPQRCYLDESTSETTNDVCIRWSAPLVWMAAFLSR
jgi:hypothetical protein